MRVEQLGDGPPEVAVVGGIHGDEPCGVHAVETILDEEPDVDRPVAFVIANEAARANGVRYVEEDLNRSFPGEQGSDVHERALAAELDSLIADCDTLALHSTQSYRGAFALVSGVGSYERTVCPALSVDSVVETSGFTNGRIFASAPRTVEVECGYQGSETAAENAVQLTREFLAATGVLPSASETDIEASLPVFDLGERIPKPSGESYEVYVENFERVPAGEAFAAVDGEKLTADETFYPVLLSAYGYENQFGYAATHAESLDVSAAEQSI
ncbi:succinylglutamate desuccinylase/aspartoacylase family protein [Haloarculaceae archaeon H-GB2-1]|nr:succinylglutamate desuccinylase/aspartoacylase family protein [Haloarculaceae archaeon H-GB1-1]MEA5386394.1 succinylglutamate desuccinylase/aspartoacylase family protein [Haloarculaceae archaeon H-GB11]MEA5407904.1 succinylglutamate desuccinylase/aspartoacylase family protein [Haloarculaceae archaeon H-GB2-1]